MPTNNCFPNCDSLGLAYQQDVMVRAGVERAIVFVAPSSPVPLSRTVAQILTANRRSASLSARSRASRTQFILWLSFQLYPS